MGSKKLEFLVFGIFITSIFLGLPGSDAVKVEDHSTGMIKGSKGRAQYRPWLSG